MSRSLEPMGEEVVVLIDQSLSLLRISLHSRQNW